MKKIYRQRKLVRVTQVIRLGTQVDLSTALQGMGFLGRLNTAFIERVNLTIRHVIAAVSSSRVGDGATVLLHVRSSGVVAHVLWMSRPHASLRVALMQPLERGGKRPMQRYRQRTPAMEAGRTTRRWTAREVLVCLLPPLSA